MSPVCLRCTYICDYLCAVVRSIVQWICMITASSTEECASIYAKEKRKASLWRHLPGIRLHLSYDYAAERYNI